MRAGGERETEKDRERERENARERASERARLRKRRRVRWETHTERLGVLFFFSPPCNELTEATSISSNVRLK